MAKRDYYEVLGVDRSVDAKELKKAYRRVAMKFHPDRNPGDTQAEEKFKEANEAYEVLSDAEKRAAYDRFGHDAMNQGGFGGGGGANMNDIFGDMFGDIFGGSRGGRQRRGSDLQYNLDITLEQAVAGTTTTIEFPATSECEVCHGSGAKPGTSANTCRTCGGAGQVRMSQGFFSVQQTCSTCRGSGKTIDTPCTNCHGQGLVQENKKLQVKIPAGVDTGDRIRLTGEGEAGPNGAPAGDLYVQMQVKQHAIFERDGADLHCKIPINFVDAALGAEIEVPTLGGKVRLKVPPETQSGKLFRLRGKGVKPVRSSVTGDLLCRVEIETPVNLTKQQKELLEQLRESFGDSKHSPRRHTFFDGVKRFFDDLTG